MYFKCIENYEGIASNMLQIVNIQSLFERFIPELEERLKNSFFPKFNGIVEIAIEKDKVQLHINNGKLKCVINKKPDIKLFIKEFYLLHLILGLLSFEEVKFSFKNTKLRAKDIALFNTLFPRKLIILDNWC